MRAAFISLLLVAFPTMAQTPCGTLNDATPRVPRSWSYTQPNCGPHSIVNIQRASNVVTVEVADASCYAVNDYIVVEGVTTDPTLNVGFTNLSTVARSSGTATLVTSAAHNIPNGAVVNVESSNLSWYGPYTVSAVPSTTQLQYVQASGLPDATATADTGKVYYAVQVTGVTATTITFAQTGSNVGPISSEGTVQTSKWLQPPMGSSYVDPQYGCTVEKFFTRSYFTPNTSGTHHFYSTTDFFNADGTKAALLAESGGYKETDVTTKAVSSPTLGGASIHLNLDPQSASHYYRINGATIQRCVLASGSCSNVWSDVAYNEVRIGGGGSSNPEAPVSNSGQYIPVRARRVSDSGYDLVMLDRNGTVKWTYALPTGAIEMIYAFDDGAAAVRFTSQAVSVSSISCSADVITVNATAHGALAGEKVRVTLTSQAAWNGLYTVATVPSANQLTYSLPSCSSTSSGGTVISQSRGLIYIDSSGVFNNAVARGAHGTGGREGTTNFLVQHANSSDGPTGCTIGAIRFDLDASEWGQGSIRNDDAKYCVFDTSASNKPGFGSGTHISVDSTIGYAAVMFNDNNTGRNAPESTITSLWPTGWKIGHFVQMMCGVFTTNIGNCYHLAHVRSSSSNYWKDTRSVMRSITGFGTVIVGDWDFRDGSTGSRADQFMLFPCGEGNICFASGAPVLSTIAPESGNQNTTVSVTLTGTGMGGANPSITVSGAGVTVSNLVQVSSTSWTADFVIDVAAATGARNVSVTTDDGTSGNVTFTVNAAAAPTISVTGLNPSEGWRGAQISVVITGTNLNGANPALGTTCQGSGVTFPSFVVNGATQITAQVLLAADATVETCAISVTTDDGTSNNQTFTVRAPTKPARASVF